MVGLGDLPGGSVYSSANRVSADGSVIVGGSDSSSGYEVFHWTSGGGMVGLGYLPGGSVSEAYGVSADGSVIVGLGTVGESGLEEAFRWTSGGGMVGLGDLPGGSFSFALSVSADGSVIVGESALPSGDQAFHWTSGGGMQSLRDLLIAGGVTELTNWSLESATGVSADGLVFVGYGTNPSGHPEAWIATIPEPSSLVLALVGLTALIGRQRRRGRR